MYDAKSKKRSKTINRPVCGNIKTVEEKKSILSNPAEAGQSTSVAV